jgi:hypothetical protein
MGLSRFSQVISDKCARRLSAYIGSVASPRFDVLAYRSTFKQLVLNDARISVEIVDATTFRVFEYAGGILLDGGPALSEARISDFLLGAQRVRKQYETLQNMLRGTTVTAWLVVTAYYCAYFASVEISKLLGRGVLSLDSIEIEALMGKAAGPGFKDFFSNPPSNFSALTRSGTIEFRSAGARPHAVAWQNIKAVLNELHSSFGWPEVATCLDLIEGQGSRISSRILLQTSPH